ncbi:MAG: twitching motility protein [Desulforhopalus sp.]
MELKDNQSAVILETDDDGEIIVNVASADLNGLTGSICKAIAEKLMSDEQFQAELMQMLEEGDSE